MPRRIWTQIKEQFIRQEDYRWCLWYDDRETQFCDQSELFRTELLQKSRNHQFLRDTEVLLHPWDYREEKSTCSDGETCWLGRVQYPPRAYSWDREDILYPEWKISWEVICSRRLAEDELPRGEIIPRIQVMAPRCYAMYRYAREKGILSCGYV